MRVIKAGKHMSIRIAAVLGLLACALPGWAAGYKLPLPAVQRAFDLPAPPVLVPDPRQRFVLLAQPETLPSIARLAADVERHLPASLRYGGLRLKALSDLEEVVLHPGIPARIGYPRWAPAGERFVFDAASPAGVELWLGSVDGSVRPLPVPGLQQGRGHACEWMPDGERLLCRVDSAPEAVRGALPAVAGPLVLDTAAVAATDVFIARRGFHSDSAPADRGAAWSRLALVDVHTAELTPIGAPARIVRHAPSPDGRHVLVATRGGDAASSRWEAWDLSGKRLMSMRMAQRRMVHWQAVAPATLSWVESAQESQGAQAGQGADAGADRIVALAAPFDRAPGELFRSTERITEVRWVGSGFRLLVTTYQRSHGRRTVRVVGLRGGADGGRLLWQDSVDSVYDDPGTPLMGTTLAGSPVIAGRDDFIYLSGGGATPQGAHPFLDRLDLETLQRDRLWHSGTERYETVDTLLSPDASVVLISHESSTEPRSYQRLNVIDGTRAPITQVRDAERLARFTKRILRYTRADGVALSATLYLPADHRPQQRLPLVIEAYPRNHVAPETAGEVHGSTERFEVLRGMTALPLVTQGYAVLRNVSMPIIGDPATGNDSFAEQIVANARAAIDTTVDLGFVDRTRVGVVGHSYGAFMVAMLLSHSDLFRAGVAASGAYNRTLTPFGFQTERRSLWQAPQTYLEMSPFLLADRIKNPLLLIHGDLDDNAGTAPQQSRQLYQAIDATGGTARLVILPYEGHVYRARESVLHAVAEMIEWFDRHLHPLRPARIDGPIQMAAGRAVD
jgi:dipeptidyl aminopeptidase/acylaminoacyl peptidase